MALLDIKKEFENKSLEKRIDFIDNHDFVDDVRNRDYIVEFIKNSKLTSNYWYDTILIDTASDLYIKDDQLLTKYLGYLEKSNNYLIKLAVLDYIAETYNLYVLEWEISMTLLAVKRNKYYRMIVKNQSILLLMLLNGVNKEYKKELLNNLKRTKDYRAHIRLYNFIKSYLLEVLSEKYIAKLIKISQSKHLGKAVDSAITNLYVG